MASIVRIVLREWVTRIAWYTLAFFWVGSWGVLGLYAWEPIWRAVFYQYTLDGGFVAGFAHALGLVGFLAGVVVGVTLSGLAVRRWG